MPTNVFKIHMEGSQLSYFHRPSRHNISNSKPLTDGCPSTKPSQHHSPNPTPGEFSSSPSFSKLSTASPSCHLSGFQEVPAGSEGGYNLEGKDNFWTFQPHPPSSPSSPPSPPPPQALPPKPAPPYFQISNVFPISCFKLKSPWSLSSPSSQFVPNSDQLLKESTSDLLLLCPPCPSPCPPCPSPCPPHPHFPCRREVPQSCLPNQAPVCTVTRQGPRLTWEVPKAVWLKVTKMVDTVKGLLPCFGNQPISPFHVFSQSQWALKA